MLLSVSNVLRRSADLSIFKRSSSSMLCYLRAEGLIKVFLLSLHIAMGSAEKKMARAVTRVTQCDLGT